MVDGEKQIGLNKNMTGFATDFPYIYSNGDFGIVVVNVLPYGTVRIIPNHKGFSKIFESPADSNLEYLQKAYGDELIVLDSIDQFSEDERKFYLSESGFDSREKEFFRLRVYEEKTLFETAEIMGYSPRTIDRINRKVKKKIVKVAPMYYRGFSLYHGENMAK